MYCEYHVCLLLTHLKVSSDGSKEVDNVLVVAQVAHDLQLRHQGLQQVLPSIGVQGLHSDQGLALPALDT